MDGERSSGGRGWTVRSLPRPRIDIGGSARAPDEAGGGLQHARSTLGRNGEQRGVDRGRRCLVL